VEIGGPLESEAGESRPKVPLGLGSLLGSSAGWPELREALRFFLAVLALTTLETAFFGVFVLTSLTSVASPDFPILFFSPPVPGINYAGFYYPGAALHSSGGFFLLVAPGLVEILALFLLLLGWSRWREGLRIRAGRAIRAGAEGELRELRRARVAYTEASLTYALLLVLNGVLGGVWFLYATQPLVSLSREHHTSPWTFGVVGAPLVVVAIATYFFTGESFRRIGWSVANPPARRRLLAGLILLTTGGALTVLAIAEWLSVSLAALTWLSPAIAFTGIWLIERAYVALDRRETAATAAAELAKALRVRAASLSGPVRPTDTPAGQRASSQLVDSTLAPSLRAHPGSPQPAATPDPGSFRPGRTSEAADPKNRADYFVPRRDGGRRDGDASRPVRSSEDEPMVTVYTGP
jgi:hypothetical protein